MKKKNTTSVNPEITTEKINKEGYGFTDKQLKNIYQIVTDISKTLNGKIFSMGSGGGFFHIFVQRTDNKWLGFHCVTGDITLSEPFKDSQGLNSLYEAFWEDPEKVHPLTIELPNENFAGKTVADKILKGKFIKSYA
jgi:hypothetical protein